MNTFLDPRFAISYTIILLFGGAYIFNPSETMNGALIAAFAVVMMAYPQRPASRIVPHPSTGPDFSGSQMEKGLSPSPTLR